MTELPRSYWIVPFSPAKQSIGYKARSFISRIGAKLSSGIRSIGNRARQFITPSEAQHFQFPVISATGEFHPNFPRNPKEYYWNTPNTPIDPRQISHLSKIRDNVEDVVASGVIRGVIGTARAIRAVRRGWESYGRFSDRVANLFDEMATGDRLKQD